MQNAYTILESPLREMRSKRRQTAGRLASLTSHFLFVTGRRFFTHRTSIYNTRTYARCDAKQTNTHTNKQTNKQTHKQTNKQTHTQTHNQYATTLKVLGYYSVMIRLPPCNDSVITMLLLSCSQAMNGRLPGDYYATTRLLRCYYKATTMLLLGCH